MEPTRTIAARRLRVPLADWPAVIAGTKTEFRMAGGTLLPHHVSLPQPVIGWCSGFEGKTRLLVLEACFTEELLAISPESLAREGFQDIDEFRTYWRGRYGSFRPMDKPVVYRVRPLAKDERDAWAIDLFDRLFGEVR